VSFAPAPPVASVRAPSVAQARGQQRRSKPLHLILELANSSMRISQKLA
jgi:hypothetical protein